MPKIEILSSFDQATYLQKKEIADFLFVQLEQYGDPFDHILKCLDYALDQAVDKGGFVVMARELGGLVGAVVVNKTGMSGYIPENILVYIAVDASQRGKGVGKTLMKTAIDLAHGDIALHVEPDNPAKKLYEKLGFTNKYLEMRLKK
jgi:[ribosomal protein S18]-alanine N-acetyltransferase